MLINNGSRRRLYQCLLSSSLFCDRIRIIIDIELFYVVVNSVVHSCCLRQKEMKRKEEKRRENKQQQKVFFPKNQKGVKAPKKHQIQTTTKFCPCTLNYSSLRRVYFEEAILWFLGFCLASVHHF